MVPPGGRQGGSGEDGIDDKDAKHLLDSIGKIVHDKVKEEAKTYEGELKAGVSFASIFGGERASTADPCNLDYSKLINGSGGNGERHPCKELSGIYVERFSDKIGGQCTKEKISGSTNTCGACAPFRRLHLCHHNLETIETTSMTKHDLLLEVCMAAYYEGDSIRGYHPQHKRTNPDTKSQLCTELARSFADIGDIIRGKDLFLGNDKEKEKREDLEKNLKKIFEKIHEDVTTNGKLKARYNGDKENFYQLREDWWTANRETVWKAITCGVSGSHYFRQTCGDSGSPSMARDKCRCKDENGNNTDQVPTYFDYVPQFLRWFEEWAEDFCRKRKHKLQNAIKKCRGDSGNDRYCDLNRHNCEKTIRGDHVFVEEFDCNDCSVACKPFVKWIDNQKLEFLKQRKKYKSEISDGDSGRSRKKRAARSSGSNSDNNRYEKKFYKKMKEVGYQDVEKFLEKLNEERICKDPPTVGKETADASDFTKTNLEKTFDHTKYCQACPWCGAQKESGGNGKWIAKDDETCGEGKDYKNYENTQIPILTGDKTKGDMVKKYNKFCKNNGEKGAPGTANGGAPGGKGEKSANGKKDDQIKTWECYYKKNEKDVGKEDINFCVLQEQDTDKKKEMSMHYNAFFWDWVYHMLHDSLDWRNELGSCINNESKVCKKNKCNSDCDCFLKWVNEKKTEWEKIKEHFRKQGDIAEQTKMDPGVTLEYLLKKDLLLESIKDTHANAEDIERIGKMLEEEETEGTPRATGQKSTIVELLKHEKDEAEKCKKCEDPKPSRPEDPGRSERPTEDALPPTEDDEEDADAEEDDDEDEVEEGDHQQQQEEETPKEDTGPQETQLPDACTI
ncbi:hypothetical protein PFMALIP_00856, partial [Plasmodium falciparum MaliPS096_E11]